MKIERISAYGLDLPFTEGAYRCRNRTEDGFASTIVEIETDVGLTGWGEIAPLGAFYSEAFAGGIRAGLAVLAPELLGADPREPDRLSRVMDAAMAGQYDVKTPLDMALWDLVGKAAGLPLAECLGGRYGTDVALYRSVSQDEPAAMCDSARRHLGAGYRRLQVKVGGDPIRDAEALAAIAAEAGPDVTLFCDANGAWASYQALRFLAATREIDYVLEQPCAGYEDCLAVRRACARPFVLDESLDGLDALLRIRADGAADDGPPDDEGDSGPHGRGAGGVRRDRSDAQVADRFPRTRLELQPERHIQLRCRRRIFTDAKNAGAKRRNASYLRPTERQHRDRHHRRQETTAGQCHAFRPGRRSRRQEDCPVRTDTRRRANVTGQNRCKF